MKFTVSPQIFAQYPGLTIGILVARNVNNKGHSPDLQELLKQQQQRVKEQGPGLLEHAFITLWRKAYSAFGAKPKEHQSSLERLVSRIFKDKPVGSVSKLVDIYNYISLKYLLPVGGEDIEHIKGAIRLTHATAHEAPVQVLGDKEAHVPREGEVIYKDDQGVLCRRWNWKEAERVKITQDTGEAVFVLEALQGVSCQVLQAALDELAWLVTKYTHGSVSMALVSAQKPEITLETMDIYTPAGAWHDKELNIYVQNSTVAQASEQEEHDVREALAGEHKVRLEKVAKMRALGIEPWPDTQPVTAVCQQVVNDFEETGIEHAYAVAGRIMAIRLHGKAAFAQLQDGSGRLQLYFKTEVVGEQSFKQFKEFIDTGDIIWASGVSFRTNAGEITLKVTSWVLLSKCLYPLPEKFHGLTDIETKYRQRYLDLMTNKETRERFAKRSHIIALLREYLDAHGYLEVETPMLHPIAGGAAARPFVTHHNTLDTDFYLRIAPELYLKRLVIGGLDRVYEINRNFRNEGVSTRHNPEFTMLEFYTAYKDYVYSMDFVEQLLQKLAQKITGSLQLQYGAHMLNFAQFERISIKNSVLKYGNLTEADVLPETIDTTVKTHRVKLATAPQDLSVGEKIFALFEHLVEPKLIQPTFITDFPIETSPLAKRDSKNPTSAPRYELFIGGMEISNSYNELNEPFDQAERFKEQLKAHAAGNEEAHQFDAEYVKALEYGLPPAVGVGIGIDRLVMLLTNTTSIKEVILFPALKKKDTQA